MQDAPIPESQARMLRFLKWLVTGLTATMIVGFILLIALLVTRFPMPGLALPAEITLPDGAVAMTFTYAEDWYAVVTEDDQILIYDRADHQLRRTIRINE